MKYSNIYLSVFTLLASLGFCACTQFDEFNLATDEDDYISINIACSDMLPTYEDPMAEVVDSRAASVKIEDEKRINSLHLFFFDKSGNLATMANKEDMINAPYVRLEPGTTAQAVKIPKDCFEETNLIVVAIANIEGADGNPNGVFRIQTSNYSSGLSDGQAWIQTLDTDSEKEGFATFTAKDFIIQDGTGKSHLEQLQEWIYAPSVREMVRALPNAGMPMISDEEEITNTTQASLKNITMRAMMARVEVNISLSPNQISHDGSLPRLVVESYGVENMATTVPYNQPRTTNLTYGNIRESHLIEDRHEVAANSTSTGGANVIRLLYYTYENIQGEYQKQTDYPDGVNTDAEKQRWKPIVAQENGIDSKATRIVINGTYTTDQNFTYKAKLSIYLGGNTTTDFSVKRNHCYTNNVTIKGLDYVRNDDDGLYTFDGRVNVIDENNVWYMSIVNERKVDAHASVLPMDIYLVLREGTYKGTEQLEHPEWSEVSLEITDQETGLLCDWIGFEMIPYAGEDGMIAANGGNTTGFVAGTKAQDYFLWDLVTNGQQGTGLDYSGGNEYGGQNDYGLRKKGTYRIQENEGGATSSYLVNGTSVYDTGGHIDGPYSRMRIYFYIDENVPSSANSTDAQIGPRHAVIKLKYTNSNHVSRDRTIEIDQQGLLYVYGTNNNQITQMYIENYEEYLEHSDPLEYHESPEMFEGLPWGPPGAVMTALGYTGIINGRYNSTNNENTWYHRGRLITSTLVNNNSFSVLAMSNVYLYNAPHGISEDNLYALNYCYGKNKRNSDGSVWTGGNGQWELPGIRDLEVALENYYSVYPEFQNYFYWSSAPSNQNATTENTSNARACKVTYNNGSFSHVNSNYQTSYPTGGNAPRNTRSIRIRAAYKTNAQNNSY